MPAQMKGISLIVGLGNIGSEYDGTRHNAGFMAADRLAEKHGMTFNKRKFDAEYGEINLGGSRVILAKPQTYMNESGRAVAAIARFYKFPPRTL